MMRIWNGGRGFSAVINRRNAGRFANSAPAAPARRPAGLLPAGEAATRHVRHVSPEQGGDDLHGCRVELRAERVSASHDAFVTAAQERLDRVFVRGDRLHPLWGQPGTWAD